MVFMKRTNRSGKGVCNSTPLGCGRVRKKSEQTAWLIGRARRLARLLKGAQEPVTNVSSRRTCIHVLTRISPVVISGCRLTDRAHQLRDLPACALSNVPEPEAPTAACAC